MGYKTQDIEVFLLNYGINAVYIVPQSHSTAGTFIFIPYNCR